MTLIEVRASYIFVTEISGYVSAFPYLYRRILGEIQVLSFIVEFSGRLCESKVLINRSALLYSRSIAARTNGELISPSVGTRIFGIR